MKFSLPFVFCLLLLTTSTAQAVVTTTGDVDLSSFASLPGMMYVMDCYVGSDSDGSLLIDGGSVVETEYSYLGYGPDVTGEATVSGAGSTWNIQRGPGSFYASDRTASTLYVGYEGNGILNINDGGNVNVEGNATLGYESGSTGTVTVDGVGSLLSCDTFLLVGDEGSGTLNIVNDGLVEVSRSTVVDDTNGEIHFDGGTLTTEKLIASPTKLTGTGTINTHSFPQDHVDRIIDSPDDLVQTIMLNSQADQNITLNHDMNSPSELIVGNHGTASLEITNGVEVVSTSASLGYHPGSDGTLTVSGASSTWNYEYMTVGDRGNGVLNITDGAKVNKTNSESNYGGCILGYQPGSSGIVNVSGPGSTLDSGWVFFVGWNCYGELNITDGGVVNCNQDSYNGYCIGRGESSQGKVTVSDAGSAWNITTNLFFGEGQGELNITNGGTVNVNDTTWLKSFSGNAAGTIHFDGGTLNTGSLMAGSSQLTGIGTINTQGLIADGVDLVINAEYGLQQTFHMTGNNKNIKVNLNCNQPIYMGAGFLGHGTLTVQDGLKIHSDFGYLGHESGSDGEATISGIGSTWEISTPNSRASNLNIGYRGNGTLNILDGGAVSVQDETYVARIEGASGSIHFDNGTLTTGALYAGADQLTGTGTIHANGIIVDGAELVFKADGGLQQTFHINATGQDITVHVNQNEGEILGAGYTGTGSFIIQDGVNVKSYKGYLGYQPGSEGIATVSGVGSQWHCTYDFQIGHYGSGELNIIHGGTVNSGSFVEVGCYEGSTGTVNVSGEGSTWYADNIDIGFLGDAHLNITDGGTVDSESGSLGDRLNSTGTAVVSGSGSTWITKGLAVGSTQGGSGQITITNGGIVQIRNRLGIYNGEAKESFIDISDGGMLAIQEEADDSLTVFLDLVQGTDAIRWWDDSIDDWASITTATLDTDYTLEYFTEGDLSGYTLLTVGVVPEPGTVALILSALLAMGLARRPATTGRGY